MKRTVTAGDAGAVVVTAALFLLLMWGGVLAWDVESDAREAKVARVVASMDQQ